MFTIIITLKVLVYKIFCNTVCIHGHAIKPGWCCCCCCCCCCFIEVIPGRDGNWWIKTAMFKHIFSCTVYCMLISTVVIIIGEFDSLEKMGAQLSLKIIKTKIQQFSNPHPSLHGQNKFPLSTLLRKIKHSRWMICSRTLPFIKHSLNLVKIYYSCRYWTNNFTKTMFTFFYDQRKSKVILWTK